MGMVYKKRILNSLYNGEKVLELDLFEKELSESSNITIYGAGIVAYGVNVAIKSLFGAHIQRYVVGEVNENPDYIEDCPVLSFREAVKVIEMDLVIIAMPEVYHEEIIKTLKMEGIFRYIAINSHLEFLIMSAYYKQIGQFPCIPEAQCEHGFEIQSAAVYMAKSHKDIVLKSNVNLPEWIKTIQVGAALTDRRQGTITDDSGDNISDLNGLYGELTATYWIWKNDNHKITGLFHYRRVLLLEPSALYMLDEGMVDAILPLPFLCYQDTSWQYGRYLCREDIAIMWNVLKEMSKEYYDAGKIILSGKYLYNYNIVVARKEVFDDYCAWFFPILDRIKVECQAVVRSRKDRYIGRIGELLTSLFFLYNKKGWKIMHGEKKWIV